MTLVNLHITLFIDIGEFTDSHWWTPTLWHTHALAHHYPTHTHICIILVHLLIQLVSHTVIAPILHQCWWILLYTWWCFTMLPVIYHASPFTLVKGHAFHDITEDHHARCMMLLPCGMHVVAHIREGAHAVVHIWRCEACCSYYKYLNIWGWTAACGQRRVVTTCVSVMLYTLICAS